MNKFIKEELNKCKVAQIPPFDDNTTQLIITKGEATTAPADDLVVSQYYLIAVEDYIIHPYEGFTLHDNWNNGIVPTDKKMHIQVTAIMGKMIKVEAVGVTDGKPWAGWLPKKSIHILEG